jgi:hypothetical protein
MGNRATKELRALMDGEPPVGFHMPIHTRVRQVGVTPAQQKARAKMKRCANGWKHLPESRKADWQGWQDFVRDYHMKN